MPPLTSLELGRFNTLGLDSLAALAVRFTDRSQLPALSQLASMHGPAFVLGGGSNIVLEAQLQRLLIKVETRGVRLLHEDEQQWLIEAEAGENWHDFVMSCVDRGWWGLENLALIPGTVGAAPVQNIGAYGLELDQRLHSVLAWNLAEGRLVEMEAKDCGFAYRDSLFKRAPRGQWLIVAVRFRLPRPWRAILEYPDLRKHPRICRRNTADTAVTAHDVFEAVCEIRRSKLPDPAVLGNAGSFFKNPIVPAPQYRSLLHRFPSLVAYPAHPWDPADSTHYKLAAGWLIDQCGWKGKRQGPVGVHERQALVLVNYGGATAQDIRSLSQAICQDVYDRFGVQLEQEPVAVA